MKHGLVVVAYGVGGLLVAVALTLGAYAIAGSDIGRPAPLVGRSVPVVKVSLSPTPSEDREHDGQTGGAHESPSPPADDNAGASNSGSGTSGSGTSSGSSSSGGSDDTADTGSRSHGGGQDD